MAQPMDVDRESSPSSSGHYTVIAPIGRTVGEAMISRSDISSSDDEVVHHPFFSGARNNVGVSSGDDQRRARVWPSLTRDVASARASPAPSLSTQQQHSGPSHAPEQRALYAPHAPWSATVPRSEIESADYFLSNPIAAAGVSHSHLLRTPASFGRAPLPHASLSPPEETVDPRRLAESSGATSSSEDAPGPSTSRRKTARGSNSPAGGVTKKTVFHGKRAVVRDSKPRGRAGPTKGSGSRPFKCKYTDPVTNEGCGTGGCVKVYDLVRHLVTMHAKDELAHVQNHRLEHDPDRAAPSSRAAPLLHSIVQLALGTETELDWEYLDNVGVTKRFDGAAAAKKSLLGLAKYLRCWARSSKLGGRHKMSLADNNKQRPADASEYDNDRLTLIFGSRATQVAPSAFGGEPSGEAADDEDTGATNIDREPTPEVYTPTLDSDQPSPPPTGFLKHLHSHSPPAPSPTEIPATPSPTHTPAVVSRALRSARPPPLNLPTHLGAESPVARPRRTPARPSSSLPLPLASPFRHASFRLPRSPATHSLPSHSPAYGAPELSPFGARPELLSPALQTPELSTPVSVRVHPVALDAVVGDVTMGAGPWLAADNALELGLGDVYALPPSSPALGSVEVDEMLKIWVSQAFGQSQSGHVQPDSASGNGNGNGSWQPTPDAFRPACIDSPDVRSGETHDVPLPETVFQLYTSPGVVHPGVGVLGDVYSHTVAGSDPPPTVHFPSLQLHNEEKRENPDDWFKYVNFDGGNV